MTKKMHASTMLANKYDSTPRDLDDPALENSVFCRFRLALHETDLTNEERQYGNAFLNLCELVKDHWKDERQQLDTTNFSVVIDKWIASQIGNSAFEADVWRRKIADFIVTLIFTRVGYVQDFLKVLVEKSWMVDHLVDGKSYDAFTRSTILSSKYYLSAIAKTLLEFEKQSESLCDFATHEVISNDLYTTAIEILMLTIRAGGVISRPFVSRVFDMAGKKHENLNDDFKQLCDKNLLTRQGTKRERIYVIAPLGKAMGKLDLLKGKADKAKPIS